MRDFVELNSYLRKINNRDILMKFIFISKYIEVMNQMTDEHVFTFIDFQSVNEKELFHEN